MPESNQTNNIAQRLKPIEGMIWDLDNTLYRFEGDFETVCHHAGAKAAIKNGLAITHEQAFNLCLQSYNKYGHSLRLLVEDYNLDHEKMHYDFHSFMDEKLIGKSLELIELFSTVNLKHILVTHASGEWARRVLSHIGLKEYFPDEHIIPMESTNFQRKSESGAPFETAITRLCLPPKKIVVIEDIAANLRIPHKMGLTTVLVHYGKAPSPRPDYVHLDYNNACLFLKHVLAHKASG